MSNRHAFTGSPYEALYGFARAVRAGDRILVAGTGPVEDDGTTTPGDAAAQAERCCETILCSASASAAKAPLRAL